MRCDLPDTEDYQPSDNPREDAMMLLRRLTSGSENQDDGYDAAYENHMREELLYQVIDAIIAAVRKEEKS